MRTLALTAALLAAAIALHAPPAHACSRVLWQSKAGVRVGRTLDWYEDPASTLWSLPAGIKRTGGGARPLEWTAKYGSLSNYLYDTLASVEAMNDRGFTCELLYLPEAHFGDPAAQPQRKTLDSGLMCQWLVDQFHLVKDAVAALAKDELALLEFSVPGGAVSPVPVVAHPHWAINDARGDSAVIEFTQQSEFGNASPTVNASFVKIYHDRNYTVMTNSPPYNEMLSIAANWKTWQKTTPPFLPGSSLASDRFARAKYYTQSLPVSEDDRMADAQIRSVMVNLATPLGAAKAEKPSDSATTWFSYLKSGTPMTAETTGEGAKPVYAYQSTLSLDPLYVKFANLTLTEGAAVKKLVVAGDHKGLDGDVTARFEDAKNVPVGMAGYTKTEPTSSSAKPGHHSG